MDMEALNVDFEDLMISAPSLNSRQQSIKKCIGYLTHACQCRDAHCRLSGCNRMKRVVQHTKACKLKVNGNCPICKQLIALCFYHSKYCKEAKCAMPICLSIKQKMKQHRIKKTQLLHRRLAAMNPHVSDNTGTCAPSNSEASSAGSSAPNSASFQAPPCNVTLPTPTPRITPNERQALQQMLQLLLLPSSPHQKEQLLKILIENPALMTKFIEQKLRQQQQQEDQQLLNDALAPPASVPSQLQIANDGPSGASLMNQNSAPAASQPAPIDLDMQVLLTLGNSANMEPQYRQALHQLMEVLRSPSSPQQQDQIVEILGSNPQLMEEFIKQKQQLQQHLKLQEQLPQQQQMVYPSSVQQQQSELSDILNDEWIDLVENFIESNRC